MGLKCAALLENPIQTAEPNYLCNGNHLLFSLMGCESERNAELYDPDARLQQFSERLSAEGAKPYIVPVGGSNALGSLGYVECALEIAEQCEQMCAVRGGVLRQRGDACRTERGIRPLPGGGRSRGGDRFAPC